MNENKEEYYYMYGIVLSFSQFLKIITLGQAGHIVSHCLKSAVSDTGARSSACQNNRYSGKLSPRTMDCNLGMT